VVSVRGADLEILPHGPSTRPLATGFPVAFRRAAAVHCVSEAARQEALAHGLRTDKARIIRPAVDVERFRPRVDPEQAASSFRVIGVGWLHWRKGWEYALQAIARLVEQHVPVTFDVVGAEPGPDTTWSSDRDRILEAIDALGLAEHVRVHGELRHDDVRALLERADVLLHTSLAEGIPNVVLEAMACGIAVVATDVGGTREVVADGVEGILVPPRDPGAAAAALEALWTDPARRQAMGRAGRARAESELTLERQTDRWVELYEHVTAPGAPPPSLRLVEVGTGWPPEPFLQRKLQGLAERGVDVAVASILAPGERPAWVPGLRLERLPHWAEPSYRALAGMAKDALELALHDRERLRTLVRSWQSSNLSGRIGWPRVARLHLRLARLRADVIHIEWASFAATCEPLFGVWNVPVVVSCHGSEVFVHPSTGHPVELARLFRSVAVVHCASQAVERAAEAHGLDGSRARVIPSAVDPNVFRPPARKIGGDSEFVVVTVAALRWVKGYEYALAAIASLVAAGIPVRYEIVGTEPSGATDQGERGRILAIARDLAILDRVRLHGHLPEPDVAALLRRADAFFQASLSEGMPTALLEAMASGLPVVATDAGGTREVLADGVEGFLVPPRDPRAAAEALLRLWGDSELRAAMGRAGRARVVTELTLEQQLDRFESLYRELAPR
jgi:glycosyltransferase involved in cell wall biosynthesis